MKTKDGFGLQWHITDKCDQRCKHCYIFAGDAHKQLTTELPFEQLKSILADYIATCDKMDKLPYIAITGGDPLLYPRVWDLLGLLKENNIKFSILGNPFHLSDEVAKKLKELGCINYQMSLDGMREIHDFIRKPGSFDATLSKIACLKENGILSTIMCTVSKLNMKDIPEVAKVAIQYQVDNFAFARYCPNPDDKDSILEPREYRNLLDKMWTLYEENIDCSTRFVLKDHLWKLYLYEKGLFVPEAQEDYIFDGCHCGISHLTVLADGTVYACRRFESKVGQVPQQSLYDIFNSDAMEQYRKYNQFDACSNCELLNYCRGCPAVAYCQNGDFYSKDPQCWKK